MHYESKKGFWERLQALDEPTKNKVLIVATAIIMVIVVYFWVAYFNNIIAGISGPAIAQNEPAQADTTQTAQQDGTPQSDSNIWQNMQNGMATIYTQFMNGARGLGNILQAPRQYIVSPPQ